MLLGGLIGFILAHFDNKEYDRKITVESFQEEKKAIADLEAMNLEELRAFAQEKGINVCSTPSGKWYAFYWNWSTLFELVHIFGTWGFSHTVRMDAHRFDTEKECLEAVVVAKSDQGVLF